jgi:hypothetical protein
MNDDKVKIIEYWNPSLSLYEVMLDEEFDKKQAHEPYEVLYRSDVAPFMVLNPTGKDWYGVSTLMSGVEFKQKYGREAQSKEQQLKDGTVQS